MDLYTLLILWVVMLAVAYFVANSKGRSTTEALIWTLFLGPIGVLIVLFQSPQKAKDPGQPEGQPGSVESR